MRQAHIFVLKKHRETSIHLENETKCEEASKLINKYLQIYGGKNFKNHYVYEYMKYGNCVLKVNFDESENSDTYDDYNSAFGYAYSIVKNTILHL